MDRLPDKSKELVKFFSGGTHLKYKKGETIIRANDTPQGVFLVIEGFVKSTATTKYGEENLLIIRQRLETFPVIWAFKAQSKSSVYYTAMTDIELLRVSREDYINALAKDPDLSTDVLNQVVDMYLIHSERIHNLSYRSASERIAYRLRMLSQRFGEQENGLLVINVPMRHQDIAASINCSRETASREMSKLEKKGIITKKDGLIAIADPEGLVRKIEYKKKVDKLPFPKPPFRNVG